MLNLGWMTAPAGLWRQGDEEPERPLRLPVPAYLIETESERILVDTGLHPEAVTDPDARYGEGTALGHFELEQEEGLAEQVDLGTVTRLVLTHLHFGGSGRPPTTAPGSSATSSSRPTTRRPRPTSPSSTATTTCSATARSSCSAPRATPPGINRYESATSCSAPTWRSLPVGSTT
jgi:Metallo-beta-lactamase superfamily